MEDLTRDAFLGGKLQIWQPRVGYRAATDPVFLAAACPVLPGQSVLDLGCGVGTAALCLASRVNQLRLFGLELQPIYATLALRNAAENNIDMQVECGDLTEMPKILQTEFDHVIANPPYYPRQGTPSPIGARDTALRAETPLAVWVETAARRLVPGGWLTLICGTDGLPDVLAALGTKMGSAIVLPLAPRQNRPARRIILRARKTGRAAFRLLAPLIIHQGPAHDTDRDSYTIRVRAILRDGGDLSEEFQ